MTGSTDDPLHRLRAADPAAQLALDVEARERLWQRLLAEPISTPARGRRRASSLLHGRPLLVIVPLLLIVTAAALAAGGVIRLGSPAKLPFTRFAVADEGTGTLVPGTVQLLPIAASDPAGGLPWGMRAVRTSRGEGCLQIGRLLDGKLGALGQDDAFHDDGRFHELPASAAPDEVNGCALLDADGRLFTNITADDRPASAWIGSGGRLGGCVPATSSPAERGADITPAERRHGLRPPPICPQRDLRNIYYGLLGPQAQSVTYVLNGQRHTLDTVGPQGAYMFVTRAAKHQLLDFANAGTADIVPVDGPIKEIHYRDGSTCHLTAKSWIGGRYACTPPLPEPVGYVPVEKAAKPAEVAAPVRVWLAREDGLRVLRVSFTARLAVTDARRIYTIRWRAPGTPPGGYAGTSTEGDLRAGSRVTRTLIRRGLRPGLVTGSVILQQAIGPGGLEGPGSVQVKVGSFAFRVPPA